MKIHLIVLGTIFLLTGGKVFGITPEQDTTVRVNPDFQYGVNAGFSNKYLWRGICYNQGLVFQPEVYVSYGNLSLSTWGNIGIWDINSANYNEVDFTLTYSNTFFNFDFESSLNYYHYFYDVDANTSEFFIGLGYPLGDFSLFSGFSFDILEYAGAIYGELGVEYEKELSDKWTVTGSLLTGIASKKFNLNYLEVNKSAFNILSANATLSYSPIENFYIDAHFQFNHTLDKELIEPLKANSNFFEIILRKEF